MTVFPKKQIIRRKPVSRFSTHSDQPHPVLKRVLENRSISNLEAIDYSLANLLPPDSLKDIDKASVLLEDAIRTQSKVLVIGDYDADGATAACIAMLGLRSFGLESIDYLVPNRFDYGYGLSIEIAKLALEHPFGAPPDLVITVDNGINSLDGVKLLKDSGVQVLITDHHLAGKVLPDADAIVNPNQPGCLFPSKSISGVGVMFYTLLALRARLKKLEWYQERNRPEVNLAALLDLVALGTIADVVPLDRNNQILVTQGVARIKKAQCRPGILALLETAGKTYSMLNTSDCAFLLAPRLNAAGRLEDMSTGIECLMTHDTQLARELAAELNEINTQRKKIETQMQTESLAHIKQLQQSISSDNHRFGYCLYKSDWHQGITGLIASRAKEKLNRPVIAMAQTVDGQLTGSARSIPELHIRDLLEHISTQKPGLIRKFGGHAMAAGLTIEKTHLEEFTEAFEEAAKNWLSDKHLNQEIFSDGELEDQYFSIQCAEMLNNAAPWGQQFPGPLFDNEFLVRDTRIVGEQHLKLRLEPEHSSKVLDAIAFRCIEPGREYSFPNKIKAVFSLDVNFFRGQNSLQLLVHYFEPVPQ